MYSPSPIKVVLHQSIHRQFSQSAISCARLRRQADPNDPLDMINQRSLTFDDLPIALHGQLGYQKERLHYTRLIQWYLPKLSGMVQITLSDVIIDSAVLQTIARSLNQPQRKIF